jgi:hypothetical protein
MAYLIATEMAAARNRRLARRGSADNDNSSIKSPRIESPSGPGGSVRRNSQSNSFGGVTMDP